MAYPASSPEEREAHKKRQAEESARFKAQAQTQAEAMLLGRTIEGVEVDTTYDRKNKLRLKLSDGYVVQVDYWTGYSEDDSLEIEYVDMYTTASSREDHRG